VLGSVDVEGCFECSEQRRTCRGFFLVRIVWKWRRIALTIVRDKVIVRTPVGIRFEFLLGHNHGLGATLGLGRLGIWRSKVGGLDIGEDGVVEVVGGVLPM
jgi:hypothetical protein